jgi:hypothetical protein
MLSCTDGHLRHPLQTNDPEFPIVQYAHDTLLILQVECAQLLFLKSLIQVFALSTSLNVNFNSHL